MLADQGGDAEYLLHLTLEARFWSRTVFGLPAASHDQSELNVFAWVAMSGLEYV